MVEQSAVVPPHIIPLQQQRSRLMLRLTAIGILTLLATIFLYFACDQVALLFHRRQQQPVTQNLANELNTFIIHYFSRSVRSLAAREEVADVCAGKTSSDNPSLLRVLNTAQAALDVSLVYVMNRDGTVVGSSNAPDEVSLTGNNYRFRPYFFHAIAGTPHLFPAVGITTNKKGLYFSAPVYGKAQPQTGQTIGVMVIKTKSDALDTFLLSNRANLDVFVVSPDGVVFASTQEQWNFHLAWPIEPSRLLAINATRQFGSSELPLLPFSLQHAIVNHNGLRATVSFQSLDMDGWQLVTLEPVPFPWLMVGLLWCIVWTLGAMATIIAIHRQRQEQLAGQVIAGEKASNLAQAAHRTSVLELETIFSTSLVGIILVRDGRIVNANRRMCEMFGYEREEIVHGGVRQFFAGRRAFRRFIRRHLHLLIDSNIEQVEYDLKRKNGSLIACTLSGKAIDRSDLSQGTVWVIEDISRRKAAERELEQARKAAEAASVAKGEFLANMSHEIRTPMNGIIGLTNILLRQEMPDAQREHLALIQRSAIRLMTIINDILDFSKLEAGRFELDRHPFSLRGLLHEVVQPMEPTVRKKNLQLHVDVDPAVPDKVQGDQVKIMQILTNLIDNSLKFTRKGFVRIAVRPHDRKDGSPGTLLFEVADSGIGIDPAYRANVFESFSQADSSHSRRFGGTGLGLSISKGLVELMGGEIWFESVPERGTHFYFTLPLPDPDTAPSPSQDATPTYRWSKTILPQGRGRRILVAEDEYINTILIGTLLKQAGFRVTVVKNGREAVNAWRGGVFDCILMDIQMPEMDGYEAVARIREAEQPGDHMPIIAMTAHAMAGDRQKCLNAGMDDYVSKPIDGSMLLQLLQHYLPDRQDKQVVLTPAEPK